MNNWYEECLKVLQQPRLNLWQWADKYRVLTKETAAEAGQWNTSRTPYMYEPMEMIGNKTTERVIIKSSAQVGKSELILNASGNIIHTDPRSFIIIQPTIDLAESFSEERLTPMLKATPCLKNKIAEDKSRDKKNTILKKSFDGGFLVLVGANAPANLASRPVGVIFADEIDRYPLSAGKEGDPLSLALKRTTTFFDKKIILVSTPTLKGASRIAQLYDEGSRGEWCLPCPKCGEYQPLEFERFNLQDNTIICLEKNCQKSSNEFEWKSKSHLGKWIHEDPTNPKKSYHLNAFASPWVRWSEIAEEYNSKKNDEEQLKVFYNTTLGLEFEPSGDVGKPQELYNLRESYKLVPTQVSKLTCGVDTQGNRLEYEIKGWGENNEMWGIKKGIIFGDPETQEPWEKLEEILKDSYEKEDGESLKIAMTFVDSGGHSTRQVYFNCAKMLGKGIKVFPIKGEGKVGKDVISRIKQLKEYRTNLILLGVNDCKTTILSICKPDSTNFRAHFTDDPSKGYNLEYFNQLFAEKYEPVKQDGKIYYKWVSIRKRNEALDCSVYAYAAHQLTNNVSKNKRRQK